MHSHLLKPLLLALQSEASTSIDLLDLSRGGGEYRLVKVRPGKQLSGSFPSASGFLATEEKNELIFSLYSHR